MTLERQSLREKKAETINRILAAAGAVFGEVGFAGARMDEIAKRAKVNKAMIYYRIGDKAALYAQVLHAILSEAAEIITQRVGEEQSPKEKMINYIRSMTCIPEKYPHMPHVMMWEFASGGKHFPRLVLNDIVRILRVLNGIIQEGVSTGVFIEMNPLILQMMIMGSLAFYKTTRPLREKFAFLSDDIGAQGDDFQQDGRRDIEGLILNAIRR